MSASYGKLNETLSIYGLTNVIKTATHFGNSRNSLLDPILVSESCKCTEASVINTDASLSDHAACTANFEIPFNFSKCYKRDVWIYKRADFDRFNKLISNTNWAVLLSTCGSLDQACELFTKMYLEFAKGTIPTKSVTIRPSDKPWMTSELRHTLRERLHKTYKRSQLNSDLIKFKHQRNTVNNMRKHVRLHFYENVDGIIESLHASDPKSYWRLIKRLNLGRVTISLFF